MKRLTASVILALAVVAGILGGSGGLALAQTRQDLIEVSIDMLENKITVAPENRCAPYDPKDYSYNSRELKAALIAAQEGKLESRYTGEIFASPDEAELDHLIALSEAHDSGACAWSSEQKKDFVQFSPNHVLASPRLIREKQGKDWAEWRPPLNNPNLWNWCFSAGRIVLIKGRYGLTVDRAEYNVLAESLARCQDVFFNPGTAPAAEWD